MGNEKIGATQLLGKPFWAKQVIGQKGWGAATAIGQRGLAAKTCLGIGAEGPTLIWQTWGRRVNAQSGPTSDWAKSLGQTSDWATQIGPNIDWAHRFGQILKVRRPLPNHF